MKKLLLIFVFMISSASFVFAINTGNNVNVSISTEDFIPLVWLCENRIVYDEALEPARISGSEEEMVERTQNYAFEGEQIQWDVLVMDKNGIQKVKDVYVLARDLEAGFIATQANCVEIFNKTPNFESCNARILEEELHQFNEKTMRFYSCTLTIETPLAMYGEHAMTVEAEDINGLKGWMDETEYWFLNPEVALTINGAITFTDARPGTSSYSSPVLVGNEADYESGVILDMFISGTDFYDLEGRRGTCPSTNQLKLGDGQSDCDHNDPFCYFASSGDYATFDDLRGDAEGYVGINYGIGFNDPNPFYGGFNGDINGYEVMQGQQAGLYFLGNTLSPGAELTVIFRLNLPEPCNGDFNSGRIYFWGEAI